MGNISAVLEPQYWSSIFNSPIGLIISALDILIVTAFIYHFTKAIVGTKMMSLVRGVLLFVFAQIIAQLLGLDTISWLLSQVLNFGVVALVVLFAPELRHILEKLGRSTRFIKSETVTEEQQLIQAYLQAVAYLSPRKIGALVAIQRTQTLQEYISTGISLNADISSELLINIFIPNTPLHDGAVIIKDNKIAVTCAYLPLSDNPSISKQFGTRHRAAIGLSEATDAFTFIVSEETGAISVTKKGVFKPHLSLEAFEQELRAEFAEQGRAAGDKKKWWGGRYGK